MPPAVAAVAAPIAGAVGSSVGGKKGGGGANKAAQQAADRQFQMQQQLFTTGLSAWQPASDYFRKLLSGDPTQTAQAVGPTSDLLKGQAQAQSRQMAATMPQGGEANAAQSAIAQGSSNDLARLYAGVQPGAATALGQLAGMPLGASAPNVGSGLKFDTHQQEQQSNAKGSLGSGVGQVLGRVGSKGSKGGSGSGAASSPAAKGGAISN